MIHGSDLHLPAMTQSSPRELILNAAMERILHYGYAKTTMAEIARDCDMSAGNIYRFFDSKLDIAEALARSKTSQTFRIFAEIADRKDESALDRLSELFMKRLCRSVDMLKDKPKLMEVAEVIGRERPEFGQELLDNERIHIAELLKQGMETGEIRQLSAPEKTARLFQTALIKFEYPPLWTLFPPEELETELKELLHMLKLSLRP
tara:strand:- start:299 stop:916 length:618 start_codon:yes stop_codon:yes gene_type:complete